MATITLKDQLDWLTALNDVVVLVWAGFSTFFLFISVAEYSVVYFLPLHFSLSVMRAVTYYS